MIHDVVKAVRGITDMSPLGRSDFPPRAMRPRRKNFVNRIRARDARTQREKFRFFVKSAYLRYLQRNTFVEIKSGHKKNKKKNL